MKILFLVISCCLSTLFANEKALNAMLQERLVCNAKYAKRYADEAKGTEYAKQLAPLEKSLGKEWASFLKTVIASKNVKLKVQTLKIELMDEIRGCYYDLEFCHTDAEKKEVSEELQDWKSKLTLLNDLVK